MDESDLRARLDYLLKNSKDPALHAAVWDHKEGRTSRAQLFRHPAFLAEVRRSMEAVVTRLSEDKALGQVRATVQRVAEAEGLQQVLTDPGLPPEGRPTR